MKGDPGPSPAWSTGPERLFTAGMRAWGRRWRRRRELRRRAALTAEFSRRVSEEVVRQMRAGGISPLIVHEVMRTALVEADRAGWGPDGDGAPGRPLTPEALRALVRNVADRENRALRVREEGLYSPGSIEDRVRGLLEQQEEGWYKDRQEERGARRAEAAAAARRSRTEEDARRLLAAAGLPVGRAEVKITTLLLLRDGKVTEAKVRAALQAFEDAYERRVRSFKEAGGQAVWPTADAVIESLFGRP